MSRKRCSTMASAIVADGFGSEHAVARGPSGMEGFTGWIQITPATKWIVKLGRPMVWGGAQTTRFSTLAIHVVRQFTPTTTISIKVRSRTVDHLLSLTQRMARMMASLSTLTDLSGAPNTTDGAS